MFNFVCKAFSIASAVAVAVAVFAVASNKAHSADFFTVSQYCTSLEKIVALAETDALMQVYERRRLVNQNRGCTDLDLMNKPGRPAIDVGTTYVEVGGYLYEISIISFLDDRTQSFYMYEVASWEHFDQMQRLIVVDQVEANKTRLNIEKGRAFFGFKHGELIAY